MNLFSRLTLQPSAAMSFAIEYNNVDADIFPMRLLSDDRHNREECSFNSQSSYLWKNKIINVNVLFV